MKKILSILFLCLIALSLFACSANEQNSADENNKVIIKVENYGNIIVELYPDIAPVTVANFKKLVSENYYDGTTFHRIIENFMIQGGRGTTTDTIKGEFLLNGFNNTLKHERGVISMARAQKPDSASSQFFICHTTKRCAQLDGKYAAFGKVLEGMEVVDAIASVQTDAYDNSPITPVVIESIRFYGEL